MPQNPPSFFAPRYFAPAYWGGELPAGSMSATLLGTSGITAVLVGIESAYSGSNFYFKARPLKIRLVKPQPAYMAANIYGRGGLSGSIRATANIGASIAGVSSVTAGVSAIASMESAFSGSSVLTARGFVKNFWTLAHAEEEFWLIAA
jgi:hypothetical protein